ncbi:hypothetical protein [Promicromonospora iranensis]|uniref:Uncharacterized protein n=1 Tax=Promicromonospora iranensis TaxID=1105144 RepID=A0ABU2CTR0_9MICO|nr:hypothetical protein [Promicromonospora iranensis]MDR7384728.1 hypothetical protein [Promicromonospora iranensis]
MNTAEALLSGWRGRRFLLELALDAEAIFADRDGTEVPLAQAVMSAGCEVPTATPEVVATLPETVRLADVDQDAALHAFADAVAHARYWQEPDGEDMLAVTPVVRAALERVARHVAGSATGIGWWSAPLDRADQHMVAWDGRGRRGPPIRRHPRAVSGGLPRRPT